MDFKFELSQIILRNKQVKSFLIDASKFNFIFLNNRQAEIKLVSENCSYNSVS